MPRMFIRFSRQPLESSQERRRVPVAADRPFCAPHLSTGIARVAMARAMLPAAPPARTRVAQASGSVRIRRRVAAKMAFATAGAIGGVAGSPTPVGGSREATIATSISGVSLMRKSR